MERLKKVLRKLLFPGTAVVILSVPLAAALLFYTFTVAGEKSPVSYISYVFSAWSLVIVCAAFVPAVRKVHSAAYRHKYIGRYLTDIPFKTQVSLYGSLAANTLYAVMKFVLGIYYADFWLITLAVYYLLLAMMRFLLLTHVSRETVGQNQLSEWRRYRLCGVLLLLMTLALSGIVILVIHQNEGFEYAGYLIYVMAAYAFYNIIMAIVNIVRYRKLGSPVLSAAKAVSMTAALVSMLALETAMLSQFGTNDSPLFRQTMTGATGAGACLIVIGMAFYMVWRSTKQLKILKGSKA